jgi:predicted transcriptional regulator
LAKELKAKDSQIEELKQNITSLEDKLSDLFAKMKYREEQKEKQKQES